MKPLVSTDWLNLNLEKVRILDASWHMPNVARNGKNEYLKSHIPGALFWDLEEFSDKKSVLPHMMPPPEEWSSMISSIGIKNNDHVIIYDDSDVKSSCRCWFNFLYFGHNPDLVSVLDGGLKKWVDEKKPLTKVIKEFNISKYEIEENKKYILSKKDIDENIKTQFYKVVDARSKKRFEGSEPEIRKGLRSGNIEGSYNLPFQNCFDQTSNTFKKKEDLKKVFENLNLSFPINMVFTCGSGVTACILGMANSIINDKTPLIYDGSWAEYGLIKK